MQIENVDTLQGVKYLTKQEMCTDQAVWFQKRKQKVTEWYGTQGIQAVVRDAA